MLPYLRILIKQRIAAWNPATFLGGKRSKVKSILSFALIMVSMLILYAMLVGIEYLMFGAFSQLGEPETMLALTGVLCTLMTVITSFFYIISELFFSKDVTLVSSLPISSRSLLTAKLIRIWLGEAGIALLICLPVVVLYGINQTMNVWYYLKALLLVPFMPMVPIAVVTLLSFALIRVSALWKRREALTVVMSMLFLVAFMWADMKFSMSSASNDDMGAAVLQLITRQRRVLDVFAGLYPPIRWFVAALTQMNLAAIGGWIGFAALNVAAVGVMVLLLGGSYQRLAIQQNETLTRMNSAAKKRVDRHGMRTQFHALYRREVREIFTVPIYAMNCLAAAVMYPMIFVVMSLSSGTGGMDMQPLSQLITLVPKGLMIAIATAVFAFTATTSMATGTAVSREGKRHEFFRTLPVKPQTQLLAKLMMGITINMICCFPMVVIVFIMLPSIIPELLIGFLCSLLFSTASTVAELMVDVAHPRFGWKNETEAIKQNGMASLGMFGSMGFIAACGGAFYGLSVLGVSHILSLVLLCAVALILNLLFFRRLLGKASKTYILQEVQN